ERAKNNVQEDEYLPSKVPTALNLLQSFENDPALAGIHPRLSALRISKIAPSAPLAKELVRPIKIGHRKLFRTLPALIWRVRYAKVHACLSDLSLMASLDLEVAHVTGYNVSIDVIKLSLHGGEVKTIVSFPNPSTVHKPGDQITYLYKLTPGLAADGTPLFGPEGHILDIEMKATALISGNCRPSISITWRTSVDFTAEQNADLVKAAHRLSNPLARPPKPPNPDALPTPENQSQQGDNGQSKAINVTLTISGPPRVKVGEMFHWDVFVVNRSDMTRKLAVLVIPRRKRDIEKHKLHPSTSSIGGQRTEKKELLAGAVVDENIVYAKQKNARIEPAELVCLTTDVRIGHLAPGACYTASLKFLPLASGVLGVDAVRVADLATQEAADVRDLPCICARRTSTTAIAISTFATPAITSHASDRQIAITGGLTRHTDRLSIDDQRTSFPRDKMIENTRRRLLYQLNSRWIYGKIPLLHCAVFLLQMAAVSLLIRKFNSYYASRPVLTTMITNAILGGIADTVAQSLTAIRLRAVRKPGGVDKDDFIAIEIHELDRKNPLNAGDLIPDSKRLPPPFDFERLTRFMAYGFLMAPVQHKWFGFLSRTFPVTKSSAMVPALKRVAFDQFLFAPIGLACFFTFMTIAEGGGKRAVTRKFQEVYVPALKANYMVWPAVQILNFRVMPIQFQIPFVSTVGIAWTAYLSLTNSSEEA
ncbi:TRAPP trafficking subunit Trs65-domain-containing protein, partial [Clohesyomyces aquaticus]